MMKLTIQNDGMQLVLKSEEELSEQKVFEAYRLITGESHDDVVLKRPMRKWREDKAINRQLHQEKEMKQEEESKPRPKAVKLLGSERTLTTPLDFLKEDHDFSPVPEDNEIIHVKVKVDCPVCSYKGERATRRGNHYSKCPNCEMKLFNAWATGSPEEQDEDGFEYYATKEIASKLK